MKILTRYVLKEYSRLLAFILLALASVYSLILFFEILDDALEHKAPLKSVLYYLLYNQPRVIKETLPMAFFFATLAYLILSNKNFEIVALKALGIKIYRILVPMALLAGVVGTITVFWNLNLVPWGISRSTEIRRIEIKKEKKAFHVRYTDIWVKHGDTTCFIHFFDERKQTFRKVRCIWFNEGKIQSVAIASQAQWKEGKWKMLEPTVLTIEEGTIREKNLPLLPLPLDITPQSLLEQKKEPWEMTYRELRDYIKAMEEEGYSVPHLKEELYQRIAMAFSPLVLVLLVFPLAVRPPREGGWMGILYSIIALIIYLGINSLFTLLGRSGWLPPPLATLIPPLGASGTAIWLLKRRDG